MSGLRAGDVFRRLRGFKRPPWGGRSPSLESWWRDLGDVSLNDKLNGLIASGLDRELAGVDLDDIVARRDQLLSGLLKLKALAPAPSQPLETAKLGALWSATTNELRLRS
jgi:hypothetical protein